MSALEPGSLPKGAFGFRQRATTEVSVVVVDMVYAPVRRGDQHNAPRTPPAREKLDPVHDHAREKHHHVEVQQDAEPDASRFPLQPGLGAS